MPFPLFYNDLKVGINKPLPTVDLDVNGSVAISGSLTVAGAAIAGLTLGAVGATPNANGASITNSVLTLQPASASFPGVVTTGAQALAGDKTLTGSFVATVNVTGGNAVYAGPTGFVGGQSTTPAYFTSARTNAANAIGFGFYSANLSTSGALHTQFVNSATPIVNIDKDGNVEVLTIGSGFILKSPDGTRYRITVANGGALSTTAA